MAYADYFHCDVCGQKAFYDSNIDWETTYVAVEDGAPVSVVALCVACFKTHEIVVQKRSEAKP